VRERPYIALSGIVQGTRALDRYSFPSGHTLHAVSFTTLGVVSFPELAWLLVPFASLVAASRVILGLHYPSDVVAGGCIRAPLAVARMYIAPILCIPSARCLAPRRSPAPFPRMSVFLCRSSAVRMLASSDHPIG